MNPKPSTPPPAATQPLDALTLPLRGTRLIEASAGTGKTWTIAALYLRLVLGHGDGTHAHGRPLLPGEILVMTFTRAATRELSDRIRDRLVEAAKAFREADEASVTDPLLRQLMAAYPTGAEREAAAWRLACAAEAMDDAAVHTIDAWCQRMLREHAFDSGSLFDEQLVASEAELRTEAAQDHWRTQVYPLRGATLDAALSVWSQLDALLRDLPAWQHHELPADAGRGRLGELIDRVQGERQTRLATLKQGWVAQADAMQQWILDQLARKDGPFDGRKLAKSNVGKWLDQLRAWASDPQAESLDLKTGNTRFTPDGMQAALRDGQSIALPPVFEAFSQLMTDLQAVPVLAPQVRQHAAACVAARLDQLKRQDHAFGFTDLLQRLDQALAPEDAAGRQRPSAQRLRERIVNQYPVALIDEFQDTSPLQVRLFDRLYRLDDAGDPCETGSPATALLLIGDPKQSIYGFRGADIHSYLVARRATQGRQYRLGRNHRSTSELVQAVNQVFRQAEDAAGPGAFRFRSDDLGKAVENPLPFEPVDAKGRPERFVHTHPDSGQEVEAAALRIALDARLLDAPKRLRGFAEHCAARITGLLNDAQAGFRVEPMAANGEGVTVPAFTRLRPADIAVLVRSRQEASAVRRALRRRGVVSVYLSDQDSVFAGAEATDLLRWLQAVASPLDSRLVRAALATRTISLDLAELHRLASDDEALDARSEQLRTLHSVWQQQGVLTMLRQTLHQLDLPARWLASEGPDAPNGTDGERRLTNVLHLAELLQTASAQLDGEQALIRWLAEQIARPGAGGDEQIVRLESDADLVQVVTVHKSKGLEYPLVFLPFASSARPVAKSTRVLSLADAQGQRTLHIQPGAEEIAAADLERLREDLRLLYVALTRARHALWLGVSDVKLGNQKASQWHRCALGSLLSGARELGADELPALFDERLGGVPGIAIEAIQATAVLPPTRLKSRGVPPQLRDLAPYRARFERDWRIGSFTALVRDLSPLGALADSVPVVRQDEARAGAGDVDEGASPTALTASAGEAADTETPWHDFPRGAYAGNFLHELLEWLAGEGFALADSPALQQQLRQRCERQGWGARAEAVVTWLSALLNRPLPALGASLAQLGGSAAGHDAAAARLLPEMEFWFPSDGLASAEVDRLCRAHLLGGIARPALPERTWRGMLMGFADLVFEFDGRYWVLDHKSNHLGDADADYGDAALARSMAEHRYDVQAAIYLLALHRLLRERLGAAYDPAQHLGGAIYLYLRGFNGPAGGCCHVPASIELLDALDALLDPIEARPA